MISWNPNGDLFNKSIIKKKIYIYLIDPRNEKFVIRQDIFEHYHPPELAWIDNNLFVLTVRDKNAKLLNYGI